MTYDFKPLVCFLGHSLPPYQLLLPQISLRAPGLNAPRRELVGAGSFGVGDQRFIAPGDKRAQAVARRSAGSPDSRKPGTWSETPAEFHLTDIGVPTVWRIGSLV